MAGAVFSSNAIVRGTFPQTTQSSQLWVKALLIRQPAQLIQ